MIPNMKILFVTVLLHFLAYGNAATTPDTTETASGKVPQAWKEYTAGAFGGACCKLFEFPFDTIKVNMQAQKNTTFMGCIRQLHQNGGIKRFYQGARLPVMGSMLEGSILTGVYGVVKRSLTPEIGQDGEIKLHSDIDAWKRFAAGASAGIAVSGLLTPIELLKIRLQTDTGKKYSGLHQCVMEAFKNEGFRGMFRGTGATLLREIPGNIAWFESYGHVKDTLTRSNYSAPVCQMVAGACAGISYNTAFYPADVVKTRLQIGTPQNFGKIFHQILKDEGFLALYKGLPVTLAKAAPSNALFFVIYEQCDDFLSAI